jgi:hypothetical protein
MEGKKSGIYGSSCIDVPCQLEVREQTRAHAWEAKETAGEKRLWVCDPDNGDWMYTVPYAKNGPP